MLLEHLVINLDLWQKPVTSDVSQYNTHPCFPKGGMQHESFLWDCWWSQLMAWYPGLPDKCKKAVRNSMSAPASLSALGTEGDTVLPGLDYSRGQDEMYTEGLQISKHASQEGCSLVQDLRRIWGRRLPGQKLSVPLWLTQSEPCKQVAPESGSLLCVMLCFLSPEPDATTTREAPVCALIHPWIIWSLWAVWESLIFPFL